MSKRSLHADGQFANLATGLGSACDPASHTRLTANLNLTRQELDELYVASGIARKACTSMPLAATSLKYVIKGINDPILKKALRASIDVLLLACGKAWTQANLYGWSVMLPRDPKQRLGYATYAGGRSGEAVVDRYSLNSLDFDYGKPTHYRLLTSRPIPAEDVVLFTGVEPLSRFSGSGQGADGIGHSILIQGYESIMAYESLIAAIDTMMQSTEVDYMEFEDLEGLMLDETGLQTFLMNLQICRRVAGIIPLSKGTKYGTIDRRYTDLDKVATILQVKISAEFGIPLPLLFETSPEGDTRSGNFESESWYRKVYDRCQDTLVPILTRYLPVLCGNLKIDPLTVSVEFDDPTSDDSQGSKDTLVKVNTIESLTKSMAACEDGKLKSMFHRAIARILEGV